MKVLIDTCSKIMSTKNLWQEFIDQRIDSNNKEEIEKYFMNKNVVAMYGNNRPYRLTGVNFNLSPESPFPDPNLKNYIEYFK